jgi:hypothetical protein
MTQDEKAILEYLKSYRNTFVSGKEISKKVGGKKRFEEEGDWSHSILTAMVDAELIESDHFDHYRLKPYDGRKKKQRTYVSPHIIAILKKSGKKFDHLLTDEEAQRELEEQTEVHDLEKPVESE